MARGGEYPATVIRFKFVLEFAHQKSELRWMAFAISIIPLPVLSGSVLVPIPTTRHHPAVIGRDLSTDHTFSKPPIAIHKNFGLIYRGGKNGGDHSRGLGIDHFEERHP